jgi:hypothetical protein
MISRFRCKDGMEAESDPLRTANPKSFSGGRIA